MIFKNNKIFNILFIICSSTIFSSCFFSETKIEDGPEASTSDLLDAIVESASINNPFITGKKNNWVAIKKQVRTPQGIVFPQGYEDYQIIDAKESDENVILDHAVILYEAEKDSDGNRVELDRSSFSLCASKIPVDENGNDGCTRTQSLSVDSTFSINSSLNRVFNTNSSTLTFHDLKKFTENFPPPIRYRSLPNCGGIPDCTIRAQGVSFLAVIDNGQGQVERNRFVLYYTRDIPSYLQLNTLSLFSLIPGFYKACQYTNIQNGSSIIPVELCEQVVDFHKGPAPFKETFQEE